MTRSKIYWGALPSTAIDGLLSFAYKSCLSKAREAMRGNPLSDRMFLTSGFGLGQAYVSGWKLAFWPLHSDAGGDSYYTTRSLSEIEFVADGNDECWLTALVQEVDDFDLPSSRFRFQKERLKMRMRDAGDATVIVKDVVEFTKQLAAFAMLYADLAAWAMKFQKNRNVIVDLRR